ncbi:MAG: L-seryl-tRNA(Sec) selenium transferase [Gemmatimonadota bacterium]|nr:L-seryl-tRNA(Sec) selenium transferase [Gemmatimonadota bacterium]
MSDPRSSIPSVDKLLLEATFVALVEEYGHDRVVRATREVIATVRASIARGEVPEGVADPARYAARVRASLEAADVPSLRPVVNATGVVLHTNLGRAPLADEAVRAMSRAAHGYTNLEYDLESGTRGSRYVHCVALLTELTGAEDALVVNNAAAALLLALNTLGRGAGVAVSRGELVEIGGGFRIPEILERSGARLVEVGSTNRTRLADYRAVLAREELRAVLKVHRSNFRITGFTEEASLEALVEAAGEHGTPLIYDVGSGLMVDPARLGLPHEPRPVDAVEAGADLVVFSGDKLLGGPQAGLVLGRAELVERMRKNPLCRAVRVDKTTLAALEATLRQYRDPDRALRTLPTLVMLAADPDDLRERAGEIARRLEGEGVACDVREVRGAVGGGTYPGVELPSWAVVPRVRGSAQVVSERLRVGGEPVVGRIVDDRLVLDLRTVLPSQDETLVRRIRAVAAEPSSS